MIRVVLLYHLRILAKITGEVQLEVEPPITNPAVRPVPMFFNTDTLTSRGVDAPKVAEGEAS